MFWRTKRNESAAANPPSPAPQSRVQPPAVPQSETPVQASAPPALKAAAPELKLSDRMQALALPPQPSPRTDTAPAPPTAAPTFKPDVQARAVTQTTPSSRSNGVATAFGQIATVLMRSPTHRTLPLSVLEDIAVPAIMTGQYSVTEARSAKSGQTAPVAVVLWASVSAEQDRRLQQEPAAARHLRPQDWTGGDIIWVVEAVGPPDALKGTLQHLRQDRWKGREVRFREA